MRKVLSFKSLKRVCFTYIRKLYNDFDAVQEAQILEQNSKNFPPNDSFQKQHSIGRFHWNARYLPLILCNLFYLIDTFIIYLKADFRHANLGYSDQLISRKLFPTSLWREADVVFTVIMIWSTGIFVCALVQDLTQWNGGKMYSLVVRVDGTLERMIQNGMGK